jgi:hypothetical protein
MLAEESVLQRVLKAGHLLLANFRVTDSVAELACEADIDPSVGTAFVGSYRSRCKC